VPCFYGGVAQLGERLLCKQEVVGSIPSASMAGPWGWSSGLVLGVGWGVVTEKSGFGLRGVASPPLGGVRCRVVCWRIGWAALAGLAGALRVFFMDCESGSGALLGAQDVSVGLGWAA
jgi:hypothetical protein